jgi:hypothetical protein
MEDLTALYLKKSAGSKKLTQEQVINRIRSASEVSEMWE